MKRTDPARDIRLPGELSFIRSEQAIATQELEIDEEEQSGIFLTTLQHFLRGGKIPKELKKLSKAEIALLREGFENSSWKVLIEK